MKYRNLQRIKYVPILLAGIVFSLSSQWASAQFRGGEPSFDYNDEIIDDRLGQSEFTFIRGIYTNYPGAGTNMRGNGWWDTDFEDSDRNFLRGVQRYTKLDTNSFSYKPLQLTDPELFEHTFLYLNMKRVPIDYSGTGPNFSLEEAESMREFMLRGGFVLIDDFWGENHWNDFLIELIKIFPDRELVKLDTSHPIFHSFFDIDEVPQVPGRSVTWNLGGTFYLDDPDFPPSVHAILDDDGRIMMVANFNTDLGDGWEHTFYQPYPTKYCNEAYKLGINYIIYALSH